MLSSKKKWRMFCISDKLHSFLGGFFLHVIDLHHYLFWFFKQGKSRDDRWTSVKPSNHNPPSLAALSSPPQWNIFRALWCLPVCFIIKVLIRISCLMMAKIWTGIVILITLHVNYTADKSNIRLSIPTQTPQGVITANWLLSVSNPFWSTNIRRIPYGYFFHIGHQLWSKIWSKLWSYGWVMLQVMLQLSWSNLICCMQ